MTGARRWTLLLAFLVGCAQEPRLAPPEGPPPARPSPEPPALVPAPLVAFAEVRAELRLAGPALRGQATWSGVARRRGRELTLDAGAGLRLEVATSRPAAEVVAGPEGLAVSFARALEPGEPVELVLRYALPDGASEVVRGAYLVGAQSPQRWLPMVFAPDAPARFDLRMDGVELVRFGAGAPAPPHLAGFAAGPFARSELEGIVLLAPREAEPLDRRRLLERAAEAAARLSGELGPLSGPWTLVVAPEAPAQELAGGATLPASTLLEVREDPNEDWLLVHELAHRWFGDHVRIATWGDLWIQEGLATWLVARDKELRERGHGQSPTGLESAGYAREVRLWRGRLARALERGDDPRLVRPSATHRDAGGAVVYARGALAMHALRVRLGPTRFRALLRRVLREHAGRALRTEAFVAMIPADADAVVQDCVLSARSRCEAASGSSPDPR
ncbi:MAG: M1 family aminopeptidase [Myxococcota bacterium]